MNTETMLPAPQQAAWIAMAIKKNELVESLTKKELAAQGIIAPIAGSIDHKEIDTALSDFRKAYQEMADERKQFTNAVEKGIVQPLMAFEKRCDPKAYGPYIELERRSLGLRQSEEKKAAEANAKNLEAARFKAHVQNEFAKISSNFKTKCREKITSFYTTALQSKIRFPDIDGCKRALAVYEPEQPIRFVGQLLSRDEMTAIYKEFTPPDYSELFEQMKQEADTTFSNYASDLANSKAAIDHKKLQDAVAVQQEKKTLEEESAINTLISTSTAVMVEAPKIKKELTVTVVESEGWAKAVMAAFIGNMPALAKFIRVKSWTKLTIGQMAEYLGRYATESGATFTGLELAEIFK